MRPIYVDEVIASMHAAQGSAWDGFATGMDAAWLYHWLTPLMRDEPFPLVFSSPRAYYPTEFFAVLLPLMMQEPDTAWMADLLRQSDLDEDPVLLDCVREAMVRD
jgi:hypothetical protein